jgi:NADP-dependent 3-hydroxy acid dehydrogenase YdfG
VLDGEKIVKAAVDKWGRIDILINNGVLASKFFPIICKEFFI